VLLVHRSLRENRICLVRSRAIDNESGTICCKRASITVMFTREMLDVRFGWLTARLAGSTAGRGASLLTRVDSLMPSSKNVADPSAMNKFQGGDTAHAIIVGISSRFTCIDFLTLFPKTMVGLSMLKGFQGSDTARIVGSVTGSSASRCTRIDSLTPFSTIVVYLSALKDFRGGNVARNAERYVDVVGLVTRFL
jgi:hypothetical protein